MKKTNMQKKAAKGIRKPHGILGAQAAARRDAQASVKAAGEKRVAAEKQVAEIERTFTLRYEW